MKITTIIFLMILLSQDSYTQILNKHLCLEPAIGMRISSAFGLIDIQLSSLVNYSLHKNLSLASHTAISFDINRFKAFKNIDVKRSITTFQKLGIGPTIFTKKSSHTFFIMAGVKYFTYNARLKNSKLEDNVETKYNAWAMDKGLLYKLNIGHGNVNFSSRIYAPVFDSKWMILENANLELGLGFKLK